jgi:hypothetical protein
MNKDAIQPFLTAYGDALSRGEAQAIARCGAVPGLVLADEGAIAVTDARQIEQFCALATEWCRAQGIMATQPELERVDQLSAQLTAVDVQWAALDASGHEQAHARERSHYLLQQDMEGQVRIRVALTRPG